MKKRLLSLLLVFVMVCGMLPMTALASNDDLTAQCTNYTVSFAVSGATVKIGTATPNGDNGTLELVVADVTGTSVTVTPTFSNFSVAPMLTFDSTSLSVNVSTGSGTATSNVVKRLQNGQPMGAMGSWTINVTVDNGDGGSGDTPPAADAADPIDITMTFADGGQIVEVDDQKIYNAEVTVPDLNEDGKLTIGEAFAAFHNMYYTGGAEAGYTETSNESVTGWVTNFWGKGSTRFSYALNYGWAHSTQDEIGAGDQLTAYFGQATDYLDLLTWFDEESYVAEAGVEKEFSVNGISIYKSGETGNATAVPDGATVTVYDNTGAVVSALTATTDEHGEFSITFPDEGAYSIVVGGTCSYTCNGAGTSGAPVVPAYCEVIVKPAMTFTTDLSESEVVYKAGADAAQLSVEAVRTVEPDAEVSYQWYSNTTNSTESGTVISGETSANYTPSTAAAGTTYYYVVASCDNLSASSKIAKVTVKENSLPALKGEANKTVSIFKGDSHTWTMSDLFTDADEDPLTCKVQLFDAEGNPLGGEVTVENGTYTYTPVDTAEGYRLKFYASDDGGTIWSEAVYTAVIALKEKVEYTIVTGDTDSPNKYLSRITECVISGSNVIAAEVTDSGKVWNITLSADTDKTAALTYNITVEGSYASNCYVSFNGADGVKVSSNAVSFSGVPVWDGNNTATVTFQTRYNNRTNNSSRMRTYTLNLSIDDGVNDAPYLKGDATASHDMRVGETYSLDLGTVFGDKDSMDVSYAVSVNDADAVAAEKAYSYVPDAADTVTLTFTANDGSLTSDTYTVTLNVRENAAPTLNGDASGAGEVCKALTYTLDLAPLFTDADGDALTYSYTVNGGEATSTAASFSYVPAEVGPYTIAFTATDAKGAVSPVYTLTLTATENPAPTLKVESTGEAAVDQYSAWTLNLGTIFADNEGDSLTYTVSIDGADAVSAAASYSLTPDTNVEKTLVFQAKDKAGNLSPTYTVTLTVNYVARTTIETGCVKHAGNFDGWLSKVTVTGAEVTEYKWRGGSGHDETKDASHELYVLLDPATADNAVLELAYALGGNTRQVKYKTTPPASVELVGGTATVSVTTQYSRMASWVTTRNYTLHFTNKANTAPAASPAEGTYEAFVSENYEVNLSSIFSDADGHPLRYTLSVNGGESVAVDAAYSEQLNTPGTFSYVFTATDIWGAKATYTVALTAKLSNEVYNVTVNVPEDVSPTFYYTEDAQEGSELTAQAAENVYTVQVPANISTISWRADGMGMSTAVSAENNSLTLYKTDYVVKAGDDTDADAVVTVKYGEATAAGNNNSFLLLSAGAYTVSAVPSSGYTAAWRNVELTEQAAVAGATAINLEYRGVGFTVPDFAQVYVCAANTRQGYPTTEIQPSRIETNGTDGTKVCYYVLNNGTIYEYRVFVPETIENSDQYVTYVGMFKKAENSAFTVTAAQLEDSDNGRKTVDHELTPYSRAETLDMANVADLYMNVNAQGYLKLSQGQTKDLYTARSWWATNCGGWALNTYYFLEPDYTYTVVGLDGQPSTDVVTIDENGKIKAVGDGTAIVLVTYDAMNTKIEEALFTESGPETPRENGFYSAIWPENTGVFVVSVGAEDSGITTGMTINEDRGTPGKYAGKNVDAEHDVIYFLGSQGEYTFTPGTEGVTVSVANPAISNNVLSFNGFVELTANTDGSVTVPLTAGRNIVKVEKDGKAEYQVITAKSVSVTVNGKPFAEATVAPGDTVTVVFDTLYNPVNRLALYNTGAAVVYSDVSGYPGKTAGNYNGGMGFYFFASNAPHQTVANFNQVGTDGSSYGNYAVKLGATLTVPQDFNEAYFTLTDGAFYVSGFSKFTFGQHREVMGQAPNSSGGSNNIYSYFGRLPDISIPAATLESIEVTSQPTKTTYNIGDVFDPAGMVVTGTYSNSAGRFTQAVAGYTFDTNAFTEVGEKVLTITYEGKTTTLTVTVEDVTLEKIEVTTPPTKTTYIVGDSFDPAGMLVTATYSDESTEDVTAQVSCTPATFEEAGQQTVTVSYGSKTTTLTVTVENPALEKIEVTTDPAKTSYTVGDSFNPAGMVVTATYSNHTTKAVTGYTYDTAAFAEAGDKTVIISYTEDGVTKTATIVVTVTASGSGSGGTQKPTYDSITVYMTFVDEGNIMVYGDSVTVYDEDEDGQYTIGNAFAALHRDYYSGGENGYAEVSNANVTGWVSKFWGERTTTFSYLRNYSWVSSTKQTIREGDTISAFNGEDSVSYSDLFTWFDSDSYSASTGTEKTFTVHGINVMGSGPSGDLLAAPNGATVKVYKGGKALSELATTVDENGRFAVTFPEAGTYTIKVSGTAYYGSYSYSGAPVVPSQCTVYVSGTGTGTGTGTGAGTETGTGTTVSVSGDDHTIHVDATVEGAKATIDEVDPSDLNKVVGNHVNTGTVTIDFSGLESEEAITTVEIPAAAIKQIAEAVNDPKNDAHSLEIVLSDGASIEFDAAALKEKASQAKGADITVSIVSSDEAKLSSKQTQAVGKRPAYDINVTSGGKYISDMGGKITVHAPYVLKGDEKARGIVVYYVDDNGNKERCETSYDPIKKRVNWKTDHLSLYMIGYDETLVNNPFIDVTETAYYFDAVLWAVDEGITNGTSATTFSPDASCTRAQMVTFLWRAAGSPKATATTCVFTDVDKDAYYYEALLWAIETKLTNGTSATTFSPDAICTRGQMATFLYRNAKTPVVTGTHAFTDVKVDAYYNDAVIWAAAEGITVGTSATTFSPDADCTRGQMVTFLYRYLGEEK